MWNDFCDLKRYISYKTIQMKKLIFAAALLLIGVGANAQTPGQFKAGVNIGLPVGDVADVASFTAGADLAYLWNISENFQLGPTAGFQNYFIKSELKDLGAENVNFVPVAASGQYSIVPNFFIGADLGYAFVTSGGGDGGFYYMPKLGYQQPSYEVYGGYRGVSNDGSISAINLGVNFKF
ncbi:Uncharacterised protein [Sphingobacterium daejeonense]|nr:Uncharacterised protein [Sphingobacterium daejeonense]